MARQPRTRAPRLDQDQEHPSRRGHHLRLDTRPGRRADTIGSLLVGVWDGPRLRYAGHVGTGFTQAALADLTRRLQPLRRADSPFGVAVPAQHARGVQWVHPQLAGEVTFIEWTSDRVLRHPSWRGLRADKNPGQVHRES